MNISIEVDEVRVTNNSESFVSFLFVSFIFFNLGLINLNIFFLLLDLGFDLGKNSLNYFKVWKGNELEEANLTLGEVELVSIAQVGNLKPQGFLFVSLTEELAEQILSPELGNLERSTGVANVSGMDKCPQNNKLVVGVKLPF